MLHTYRSLHGGLQVEAVFHVGVQAGMLLVCAHMRACQIVCKGSKASCKVHVLHVPHVRHALHVPHLGRVLHVEHVGVDAPTAHLVCELARAVRSAPGCGRCWARKDGNEA
jgi:hypothetical protein